MPTNQQLFRFLGSERATHLILLKFLAQRIALLFLIKREVKDYFGGAYTKNAPFLFLEDVQGCLEKDSDINTKVSMSVVHLSSNLSVELKLFGEALIDYAKRTRGDKGNFKVNDSYPNWDLDFIPSEFKILID